MGVFDLYAICFSASITDTACEGRATLNLQILGKFFWTLSQ